MGYAFNGTLVSLDYFLNGTHTSSKKTQFPNQTFFSLPNNHIFTLLNESIQDKKKTKLPLCFLAVQILSISLINFSQYEIECSG